LHPLQSSRLDVFGEPILQESERERIVPSGVALTGALSITRARPVVFSASDSSSESPSLDPQPIAAGVDNAEASHRALFLP